jgi:hypothetical protein
MEAAAELGEPMRRIALIWLVVLSLLLTGLVTIGRTQPAPPTSELREQLAKRVLAYHDALSSTDYQGVWDFLGPGLKKDNPKQLYVERLKAKIQKWELVSRPDVALTSRTKKTDRPVGEAYSRVNVVTTDGQVVPITQRTTWIWLEAGGALPAWYLAQEAVQEDLKK